MIGTGHPKRIKTLHAVQADLNVLQGVVQRVAEMERPRHVRGRNDDAKPLVWPTLIGLGMEELAFLPLGVEARLSLSVVETVGEGLRRLRIANCGLRIAGGHM